LVTIAPPDFLVQGIELFEHRAEEIFSRLTHLERVVILFDECEELFRRRMPIGSPESRTHGAFITAGMLPRLQDLRRGSWTVFAIATNTELKELDPAIVRPGRLDRRYRVEHPNIDSQLDHVVRNLASVKGVQLRRDEKLVLRDALERYEQQLSAGREAVQDCEANAQASWQRGEISEYFKEAERARILASQLPVASFTALDAVVKRLRTVTSERRILQIIREEARIVAAG
jgi:SpoVK/Ycf46/Vps4 family AAA+-type ATPase